MSDERDTKPEVSIEEQYRRLSEQKQSVINQIGMFRRMASVCMTRSGDAYNQCVEANKDIIGAETTNLEKAEKWASLGASYITYAVDQEGSVAMIDQMLVRIENSGKLGKTNSSNKKGVRGKGRGHLRTVH